MASIPLHDMYSKCEILVSKILKITNLFYRNTKITLILRETKLSGEVSLSETGQGYTFFWNGVSDSQPRIHGVGLAMKNSNARFSPELLIGHSEW